MSVARYEVPPEPQRPRRQRSDRFDWVPVIGLTLGVVVTLVALALAWRLTTQFLARAPLDVILPTPTVIQLTAPPTSAPTATPELATPTAIATLTPEPTPDLNLPPDVVTVGFYAQVVNTAGAGLSVRGGPSTDNIKLLTAGEGTVVLVLEGPTEGSGFTWWKVLLDDGTEGWMAAQYLSPAPAPVSEN